MSQQRLKVTSVSLGGVAEKVGIRLGDIIYELNGFETSSSEDFARAIQSNTSSAVLRLYRDGCRISLDIPAGRMGVEVIQCSFDVQSYLDGYLSEVVITTANALDGFRVVKTIDIVTSECVFGLNFFKDFFISVSDFFGGRSNTAQGALRDARRNCLMELKREAWELGANAVIAVDLDYSEFSGKGSSMLFLVASGTAVIVERL